VIESVVGPTVEWLGATGAPNAVVIAALLTRPATWSRAVVAAVRSRFGSADD
jgi:hypothetical protein